MYAIKINNRLVRDDRGCVYKYSARAIAEAKAELMVKNSHRKNFVVIKIG